MFNIETPLILAHSDVASALNVKAVYYKLDNLQPTGSFKIRGMSYQLINALKSNPSLQRVISSSGIILYK